MTKLNLPKQVEILLSKLHKDGYQAYVVGGCVRDSIMGITPHDWDICTSALPEQIMEVFADYKVIPTGLQHGTVTVVVDSVEYEITTYRIDGEYKDSRHPEKVQFVQDIKLDLMRRDFTVNALAYNHVSGVIDYFNGEEDIHNKVIKCVGNPNERFTEDALRIMRAVRFAIKYGFKIERETRNTLMLHRMSLANISIERINAELVKIMMCDLHGKEALLHELITLLSVVVPEFGRVNTRAISKRLADSIGIYEVRLALLFDFENAELESVLKRLRFPNDVIKYVTTISKYGRLIRDDHSWWSGIDTTLPLELYNKSDYFERKLLHDILYEPALLSISYAKAFVEEDSLDSAMLTILDLRVGYAFMHKEPYRLSDLEINGNDLIELGYSGKQIGNILNALLDMVMRDAVVNNYTILTNVAKSMKGLV